MKIAITVLYFLFFIQSSFAQDKVVMMDPNQIEMNGYVHENLSEDMLKRIKMTTDTFEIVDGVSFDEAIDLYKRDLDPEANLIIWEEMARVYNSFCNRRCDLQDERKEVYRALLLRSMFPSEEALVRLQPKFLSIIEAQSIISQYKLAAKPIDVIKK